MARFLSCARGPERRSCAWSATNRCVREVVDIASRPRGPRLQPLSGVVHPNQPPTHGLAREAASESRVRGGLWPRHAVRVPAARRARRRNGRLSLADQVASRASRRSDSTRWARPHECLVASRPYGRFNRSVPIVPRFRRRRARSAEIARNSMNLSAASRRTPERPQKAWLIAEPEAPQVELRGRVRECRSCCPPAASSAPRPPSSSPEKRSPSSAAPNAAFSEKAVRRRGGEPVTARAPIEELKTRHFRKIRSSRRFARGSLLLVPWLLRAIEDSSWAIRRSSERTDFAIRCRLSLFPTPEVEIARGVSGDSPSPPRREKKAEDRIQISSSCRTCAIAGGSRSFDLDNLHRRRSLSMPALHRRRLRPTPTPRRQLPSDETTATSADPHALVLRDDPRFVSITLPPFSPRPARSRPRRRP